MSADAGRCERCGAELGGGAASPHECRPSYGQPVAEAAPAAAPAGGGAVTQPLEFEAEESLARGDAARALVLASRALSQRPENLALRSLVERARSLVLQGRRGERLERRLREAHELLEQGDLASAERIAASALKLVPDHAQALTLYSRVKELRATLPAVEAAAEREIESMSASQARRAVTSARMLLEAGNERGALVSVRRALRHAHDDPELVALFSEIQARLSEAAATGASLHGRVEQARARLAAGEIVKARDLLRGVLRQEPGFAPAQALMREVREVLLAGGAPPQPSAPPAAPITRATPVPVSEIVWAPRPVTGVRAARGSGAARAFLRGLLVTLLTIAALVAVAVGGTWAWRRSGFQWPAAATAEEQASKIDIEAISDAAPDLQAAIADMLGRYGGALEHRDALALSRARPDLSADGRRALLATLEGATGLSVQLRALRVEVDEDQALVSVERTLNADDSAQALPPPVEETLRLVYGEDGWRQQ